MSTATNSRSAQLYQRAQETLPGGVSRNTVLRKPHPPYAVSGAGCRVVDLEGVERVDCSNNMASLIHGHTHPAIVAAVTKQLSRGTAFAMATEIEVEYAEYLCSRNPTFEKLRFVNSGTEAVMAAIKAARAFTGRPKIAKVEGAYHGLYDYAEVSQNASPETWGDVDHPTSVPVAQGTPKSALEDVVVVPFNDITRTRAILNQHRDQIACLLLDPMPHRVGLKPADVDYVTALREWTEQQDSLLVVDEVITFRSEFAGAQQWYDVAPDLTTLGKCIGGGFPIGAITGRADVMDVMNPLASDIRFPHSGTFSANPITMTAGMTAMQLFDHAAIDRLNRLTQRTIEGIQRAIRDANVIACVTGGGSMFRVHLKAQQPRNYREAFMAADEKARLQVLLDHLFDAGFSLIYSCSAALSTPMSEAEIDELVAAIASGLRKL